jgi:osmotically-inducible protein OsmY
MADVELKSIQRAIEESLERRTGSGAREIEVTVEDGTVTLTGPIRSWAHRDSILEIVRSTPGVQQIKDHLYLRGFRFEW